MTMTHAAAPPLARRWSSAPKPPSHSTCFSSHVLRVSHRTTTTTFIAPVRRHYIATTFLDSSLSFPHIHPSPRIWAQRTPPQPNTVTSLPSRLSESWLAISNPEYCRRRQISWAILSRFVSAVHITLFNFNFMYLAVTVIMQVKLWMGFCWIWLDQAGFSFEMGGSKLWLTLFCWSRDLFYF